MDTGFLTAGLKVSRDFSWRQENGDGRSIHFGVTPEAEGSVTILKAGSAFSDADNAPVEVSAGMAYVSVSLSVSISVSGDAGFSAGQFGIVAGIDSGDRFTLANHVILHADIPVRDALRGAFERFRLPFGASAAPIDALADGDAIECEFIGKINLGATATYGVEQVFFGAVASVALAEASNSPLGSILARLAASFDPGVSLTAGYSYYDVLRLLIIGRAASVELRVFRLSRPDLKTSAKASAEIDPSFALSVEGNIAAVLKNGAARLMAQADPQLRTDFNNAVDKLIDDSAGTLQDAAADITSLVSDNISRLPTLGITAGAEAERLESGSVVAKCTLLRPLNADAWQCAMRLDLRAASQFPGFQLGAGSHAANLLVKKTGLSLTFFGLNARTIEQFRKYAVLEYAGHNVFHFRSRLGVDASSDIFGRLQNADFYFTVSANAAGNAAESQATVQMVMVSGSAKNQNKTRNVGLTLRALIPDRGQILELFDRVTRANPELPVRVTARFAASAFSKVCASPFQNGKPLAKDRQVQDALNFAALVQAVNDVGGPAERFPAEVASYDVWARVNANLFGDTSHAPDRTVTNPMMLSNPQQAYSGIFDGAPDARLRRFSIYLENARHFMNLCAAIHDLGTGPGSVAGLCESLENILKLDTSIFPLFFLNAVLVALVRCMNPRLISISAPAPAEGSLNKFDIALAYE